MESIADSDRQVMEDAALDPRAERGARTPGARRPGKVPWTAWAGFGGSWLSAPDAYWRRRFLILAGGLAVLCLITWGMSGLLGPAKPIAAAGPGRAAMENQQALPGTALPGTALPPAAYGPPASPAPVTPSWAGPASPASAPGALTPGTPAPGAASASASGQGASAPVASVPAGKSPSVAAAPRRCSPASIVLSLFSPQPAYSPAQQPRFTVYVVSTAPGTCQLSYLPPFAHVVVTRAGEVVWDSASCAAAGTGGGSGAAQRITMTEGVPKVTTLSWNRKATSPGCAGSLPAAASGTFKAVAMAAGKSSPVRPVTLTRK